MDCSSQSMFGDIDLGIVSREMKWMPWEKLEYPTERAQNSMKYLEVLIYETERKERACGQRSNSQRYKDRVRTGWYHGNQVREKGAQRKHHW